ncbi:MAG TPA: shikimate kinase [Hanamia sp.]|nr:shikimate kinase [Hanamia sp.]
MADKIDSIRCENCADQPKDTNEKTGPNIFLIGFMGSGKSHWGHIWSLKYGYTFYDLDAQIEAAFGMTVEQIFEKEGEEKFRELERYYLHKLENKKRFLVACGGGTPCFFDNLDWMKNNGRIIYLKAEPEDILSRVVDETLKRPLLKEVNSAELLFFIQQKLKEREPVYLKADHVLDVVKLNGDSLSFLQLQS